MLTHIDLTRYLEFNRLFPVMKNYYFTIITIFISLSLSLMASSVPELDRYKSIYQKEISRLQSSSQTQRLHVPQEHIKSMRALEQQYQANGDLKNLLAVRKERERFIGDPRADSIRLVVEPIKLRNLQESYRDNYESISENRSKEIEDLKEKYLAMLGKLQTSLTKQGKIDEALVVMNEVESLNSNDNSTSNEFKPYAGTPRINDADRTLNIDTLGKLIHGKVTRWSSYNNQITIHYDFSDEDQMLDWKGGEFNSASGALECINTVAWLKIQMQEISKIECDISFRNSDHQAGVVVGNNLTALITSGRPTTAVVYQSSKNNPLLTVRDIEHYSGNRYNSVLTINSKQIGWSINGGLPRRGIANNSIGFPTFAGFGNMTSASSYDKITITGKLSSKQVSILKQQL